MSRLSIEVSPEQHQKIKALAALQGKSIKKYILEKILSSDSENEKSAIKELESLLLSRIIKAKDQSPSSKSIQQISDEVLRSKKS